VLQQSFRNLLGRQCNSLSTWTLKARDNSLASDGQSLSERIHWARSLIARGIRGLGPWMSVVVMIRFTTAMVVLHILQILRLLAMVTLSYPKPSGSCGQYRALLAC